MDGGRVGPGLARERHTPEYDRYTDQNVILLCKRDDRGGGGLHQAVPTLIGFLAQRSDGVGKTPQGCTWGGHFASEARFR